MDLVLEKFSNHSKGSWKVWSVCDVRFKIALGYQYIQEENHSRNMIYIREKEGDIMLEILSIQD